MGNIGADVLLKGRCNHAFLRDDGRYQLVISDIESGVQDAHSPRRDRAAEDMGYLPRISLLDRDFSPRRTIEINGRGGTSHIKRDVVAPRQHGDAVGSDLIGYVAVGGHPVAT